MPFTTPFFRLPRIEWYNINMLILLTLFYGWSCDRVSWIDGKSGLELPLLYKAICLPLNPGECGKNGSGTLAVVVESRNQE